MSNDADIVPCQVQNSRRYMCLQLLVHFDKMNQFNVCESLILSIWSWVCCVKIEFVFIASYFSVFLFVVFVAMPCFWVFLAPLLLAASGAYSIGDWCLSVCRHFSYRYFYIFVQFSWNLAHVIYVPICKKTGTDFWNYDFKIFGKFLNLDSQK